MCDEEIVLNEIDEILSDVQNEPETASFASTLKSTMRSALLDKNTDSDPFSSATVSEPSSGAVSGEHRHNKPSIEALCDEFVDTFLGYDSGMAQLLTQVGECHETLGDVEQILSSFLKRIVAVEREIGDLRVQAQSRATTLAHARSVERVIEAMFSRLVVPLDVVQLISATCARTDNATELGPQFLFALKRLLRYLHNRNGMESTSSAPPRSLSPHGCEDDHQQQQQGRMFSVLLSDCAAFRELLGVTEDLTLLAATHIKQFVESKFKILAKHRTNIAVQQEHLLGPLKPFVLFLKRIVPALRRVPHVSSESESIRRTTGGSSDGVDKAEFFAYAPPSVPAFHFRVARALWLELKLQYVTTMREVYFNNINRYLMQLNRLEMVEGSSGWGIFGGRATKAPAVTLPLMTDRGRVSPADFGLGGTYELLQSVLSHPLVPIVAQAKGKQITYLETFRSVNVMLCDVVTREFLFTFDFFHGDASVYVPIFLPIVQRIVDYVSEVLLQNHLVKVTGHFDANTVKSCNNDAIGLMTLIRMCQVFKSHMHNIRRLSCLNGFYDSLLGLLWPSFKKAFEAQLESLRSLTPMQLMEFLASSHRTADERLAAIHPITLRYAEFSGALMTLCGSLRVRQAAAPLACSDLADDQFTALRTNLSILRVEFLRLMTSIGTEVVLTSKSGTSSGLLTSCPLLNNVYHVMCVWSSVQLPAIDGGEFEPSQPLTDIDDYAALRSVLETAKGQFVEQCLQRVFPKLVLVVRSASSTSSVVEEAASSFCASWVNGVEELRRLVAANVSSQQNQKDILPQVCMQLLLYNTRLHAVVASHNFTHTVTRSIIVSNQQLLVKFRTFVEVDVSQVSADD